MHQREIKVDLESDRSTF